MNFLLLVVFSACFFFLKGWLNGLRVFVMLDSVF